MSHIVEATTQVVHPDVQLLRKAVEVVAGQHVDGRIADHYISYEGQRKNSPGKLAIFTKQVTRGLGIIVKQTGELVFKGDPFLYEDAAEALQQQILQTYVSLATIQALTALGYQTTAEDGEEGQIILTGVNQYA